MMVGFAETWDFRHRCQTLPCTTGEGSLLKPSSFWKLLKLCKHDCTQTFGSLFAQMHIHEAVYDNYT